MSEQIQLHRLKSKRTTEEVVGTFPEVQLHYSGGGDDDDSTDELLMKIDEVLEDTKRSLGKAAGIEAV
jgi:hypothetical protein